MIVQSIDWLDMPSREATVYISSGIHHIICFSCPCEYSIGDAVDAPLFCLNVSDIERVEEVEHSIKNVEFGFEHIITGELCNINSGIVCVGEILFKISSSLIPKDIQNGQCIRFNASRIDLY